MSTVTCENPSPDAESSWFDICVVAIPTNNAPRACFRGVFPAISRCLRHRYELPRAADRPYAPEVGTVDQTMPALFAQAGTDTRSDTGTFLPLAQLGAGPDGICVLGKRGEKLVEVHQLSFDTKAPRWHAFEQLIRAIGAIDHPAVRPVIALEQNPPTVVLEGDSYPPL